MGSSQVVLTLSGSPTVFYWYSLSGLQLQTGLQLIQRSDCRAANLQSFAAARHFCSAKILAGGTTVGMGSPSQSAEAPPAQRNFQRKFALRQVGSAKFVVPPTRERSKVRNIARLGKSLYRAAPGSLRGSQPLCFGKSPEEPLPRGSFGQLLRGGSTPRFFSQIRSVGSKPTRLAGYCQSTSGPWTTEYQSPGASLRGFCVIPQSHSLQDFSAYQYRSLFAARYNTQTAADSPRPATAGTSVPCRAQS